MHRFHKRNSASITIALTRVKDPTAFGLIETEAHGRIARFIEKPSWDEVTCNTINSGVYIFEPDVLRFIPSGVNHSVERGLFPLLLEKNYRLFGYTAKGYWMDIGTIEKYMQAHYDIIQGATSFTQRSGQKLLQRKTVDVNGRLLVGKNVSVGEFTQFNGNVCIGNNVTIGKGCTITDTVIHDGTVVKDGVRMEKALVGRDCTIESNAILGEYTALGNGTVIRQYSKL
jgi:NDP-sugar pyrophosphorylase family protein